MKRDIKDIEIDMIDKDKGSELIKEKEKKANIIAYNENIEALKQWETLHLEKLEFLEEDIKLKSEAPLPINKTFEYQDLPAWSNHAKKAVKLGIMTEKLQIVADLTQVQRQIKTYEGFLKEIGE